MAITIVHSPTISTKFLKQALDEIVGEVHLSWHLVLVPPPLNKDAAGIMEHHSWHFFIAYI